MEKQLTLFDTINEATNPACFLGAASSRTDSQIPEGFTTLSKDNLPGRSGAQRNENVCNWCDARKLCQENKDNWCDKYTCMGYARNDGRSVVFKRLS